MSLDVREYADDEEIVGATRSDRMPRLRLYKPDEIKAVLGRGSRPAKELNLEAIFQDNLPVYKRRGGGCSVVLDPGNLIISLVLPVSKIGDNRKRFKRISAWLIKGLEEIGVQGIQQEGISDLAIQNKKVGGACIYCSKEILFYSTTLLLDPDMDKVARYLLHPPREPGYRKGRSHREFMGELNSLYTDMDIEKDLKRVLSPGDAYSMLLEKKKETLS